MSESPTAHEDATHVEHISVIGAGTMGSQIAMVCALAGYSTDVVDVSEAQLEKAREQLESRMNRDIQSGKRQQDDVARAWQNLTFTADTKASAARSDFVIEAAVEDIATKRSLFAQLDAHCPDHTILSTNSSNIVSSRVADATDRPDRVCNMHFFNPALVMECVEVVPNPDTSPKTMRTAVALAHSLGKRAVELKKEVPGFLANRLLNAIRQEALALYHDDVADFEAIDDAAKTALRHPMGPFELMDLVGIDVAYLVRMAEYEQTGNPESLPDPAIKDLYEKGHYGRKTGQGWYSYTE